MAIALAVTDNADGTGGVATITGAAAGDVATIQYFRFTGDLGAQSFTTAGTITGNSTLALALARGFYHVRAISLSSGGAYLATNQVYQRLTLSTETIHYQILNAVRERILSAGLSGLTDSKVIVRWIPKFIEAVEAPPVMFICPLGAEQYADQITTKDDPGFPVACVFADNLNGNGLTNLNRDLDWRIRVSRLFRNQRLEGTDVNYCRISPEQIVNIDAFLKNCLASTLVFRFFTREERGLY